MPKTKEVLQHITELDGVRGIAILAVMVLHFHEPVAKFMPFGFLSHIIMQGRAGVDLFFVLSGFLITSILIRTKNAENYFSAFYARRSLRIFPLYYCVMLAFFAFVPFLQRHGRDLWIKPTEIIWYLFFLSNWRVSLGYNDGAQLGHFWSLAVEEQFYLLWSVLVWFTPAKRMPALTVAVIAISLICDIGFGIAGANDDFIGWSTFICMNGLALGALVAVSTSFREWMAKYWLVFVPAAVVISLLNVHLWVKIPAYDFAATAIVALATTRSIAFLRMTWLRTFGKYSYGLYVLHNVIHGIEPALVNRASPTVFAAIAIPVGIAVSFGAAWISWKVLESPFLRLKSHFNYRYTEEVAV